MNNAKRKGQVTIFVIAGILILFMVALVVYIRSGTLNVRPPVENVEVTDEVKPIQSYVNDCLNQVAIEAFIKLGSNGGFINVTGITVKPQPYESDALYFPPQIMPYWYYMHDCQQSQIGCIDSLKPPLCAENTECVIDSTGDNSIESQIDKYVENNLDGCINNFSVFTGQFDIKAGSKKIDTIIKEKGVDIMLSYPLDITVKGTKKNIKIPKFATTLDINFKDIYELATEITQGEANTTFLEQTALNLISIYSAKDSKLLPPFSHVDIGLTDTVIWTRTDVKRLLMEEILPYVSFQKIMGTINDRQILSYDLSNYSVYANGIYNTFQIKLFNETKHYNLDVSITYPYSDIYLNIGDSEIIKPDKLSSDDMILRMVGVFMTEYKFKYDLSYPVKVKIKDPNAFSGQGYEFDFAMEANIRKNIPIKSNITVTNLGGVNTLRMDSELQKVNRTIIIESYDKHTGKPLDNVIISYRCERLYDIGYTKLNGTTNNNMKAVLAERFPFCQFGGEIVYEKDGYMGGAVSYDNTEGNDLKAFKVELWPIQDKNIIVYKRNATNIANIKRNLALLTKEFSNITANETVMINIDRVKEDYRETDVPIVGFMQYIPPDINVTLPTVDDQKQQVMDWFNQGVINEQMKNGLLLNLTLANITLTSPIVIEGQKYTMGFVPGTYSLYASMTYNGNITIPKKIEKICPVPKVLGICISGWKTIEYPETNLPSFPNGGIIRNFTLTENDVYGDKDTLVLYILEMPLPTSWDTMNNMQSIEDYQNGKLAFTKPILQ
jgi:hypothetical protein